MFSRRKFLKVGSVATVGGLLFGGNINVLGQVSDKTGYFQVPIEVLSEKAALLNRQSFESLLNAVFSVRGENASQVSLRLVEIVDNDRKTKSISTANTDSFTLIFEVVGRGRLQDKIYQVSNPSLGEYPIFVSTVGRSGNRFQAVFNRVYF
jgi:hypothetical protein